VNELLTLFFRRRIAPAEGRMAGRAAELRGGREEMLPM
jgi:hypothetical protein